MTKRPLILVSPDIEKRGKEFRDLSISLSGNYQAAVLNAGGLPLTMPTTVRREEIAECVRSCDGVLLTGGDDVEPGLYSRRLPSEVRKTVSVTPDGGARDFRELILIDEVLRQSKPLLAICRGHQVLNVALGGDLIADIPAQKRGAGNHRQTNKRSEVVHEVRLTPNSLLSKITGRQTLGVNSTHHQAVGRLAPPLKATARSEDGIVEGIEWKDGLKQGLPFLLGVQFHPERLADRYVEHEKIFRAFVEACVSHGKKQI